MSDKLSTNYAYINDNIDLCKFAHLGPTSFWTAMGELATIKTRVRDLGILREATLRSG